MFEAFIPNITKLLDWNIVDNPKFPKLKIYLEKVKLLIEEEIDRDMKRLCELSNAKNNILSLLHSKIAVF